MFRARQLDETINEFVEVKEDDDEDLGDLLTYIGDNEISDEEEPLIIARLRRLIARRRDKQRVYLKLERVSLSKKVADHTDRCGFDAPLTQALRQQRADLERLEAEFYGTEMPANVTQFKTRKSRNQLPTDAA